MSTALWLVHRELRARWGRVALAVVVVASLAGAATAMELLSLAREDAVAARVDQMGPALTVVPAGVTEGALARADLGRAELPGDAAAKVSAALGSELRRTEARLVFLGEVGGAPAPIVGLEQWPAGTPDGVLIGAELARRVGDTGPIRLAGAPLPIAGVRPATGDLEDVAALLPLARAAALPGAPGSANTLRVYLRAGIEVANAAARLEAAVPGASVVRHDRGEVATTELPGSLARHRAMTYALFALAAGLCLLITAHLDTAERRVEVATLVAIGASRAAIVVALVGRSLAVASLGAAAGVAIGFGVASVQDVSAAGALVLHPGALAVPVLGACVLAVVATSPSALAAALRDPIPALQEA